QHLIEIRKILGKEAYQPEDIDLHLKEQMQIQDQLELTATYTLTPEVREALLTMTPLLQQVRLEDFDWTQLTDITISATLYQAHF
ncbi:rRNA (guanine-N1)-methyltransferase, partial [Streptococcus danieliae]|nr:rRNA (guanine-N1)-methyltransferase [Streptococcus danieliae]